MDSIKPGWIICPLGIGKVEGAGREIVRGQRDPNRFGQIRGPLNHHVDAAGPEDVEPEGIALHPKTGISGQNLRKPGKGGTISEYGTPTRSAREVVDDRDIGAHKHSWISNRGRAFEINPAQLSAVYERK